MMKAQTTQPGKKISFFLLIPFFISLNAQVASGQLSYVLDSLQTRLITATDTTRADLFLNIAEKFIMASELDSAESYALKGMAFSKSIKYNKGQAIAYEVLSLSAFERREMEQAMEYNKKAIEIWRSADNRKGLSVSLHNLGRYYYYLNDYEKALQYYFQSIEIDEMAKDTGGLAGSYMNVAIVQNRMDRDTMAHEYFLKAEAMATQAGNEYILLATSVNLAGLYEKWEDYDKAMVYALRAFEMSETNQIPLGIVKSASTLSNLFIEKKDYTKATYYADIVLDAEPKNHESRARAFQVKASALEQSGKIKAALTEAEKGLKEAKLSLEIPTILGCQNFLYELYKRSGNFEKALAYKEEYQTLSDSLFNIEKNEQINTLTTQFETVRKQKQIDDLQQEAVLASMKMRQKNGLFLFLAFLALAIFAAVYYFNQQKLSEEKRKTLLMQQKLLRTQMNPHFIFNALTAIQNFFFEKEDGPKAAFYLAKFAKLMRLILENSSEDYIQLDQEIATLENYLNLQKVRFNDSFEFSIECDPGLNQEITAVPPMLAQPFIENSIEHGLLHKEESGKVKIRFEKIEDILEFTIEDNGIGREKAGKMKKNENREHESMATRITEDRLTVLNRKLKRKAKLMIADVLDKNLKITGTKVTIQIPLMKA